ncbi:MAG: type I-B CRISPR-associated protein Cas7/Cst2/DevR [Candidatus Omnitrophica bacterium]|nr:type I-B CRISPR-associated protein Cas7/Cst2/DevR [Candidatus Omnitrophota bacterium]
MKKALTLSILFEADALNRDEKIGNVLSIKKLTRGWHETYPFISKYAIRHYLFATLVKASGWIPSPLRVLKEGTREIVQLDITKSNILTSPELDIFGYMFTIGGQLSITRKSPLGITKAIALEGWQGDIALNANHDFASRANAKPIPVNREESKSLFKVSFTFDIERIGNTMIDIEDFEYNPNLKKLFLYLKKGREFQFENLNKIPEEGKYKVNDEFEIWESQDLIYLRPLKEGLIGEYKEDEGTLKIESKKIKIKGREKKEFINVKKIEINNEIVYVFPFLEFDPDEKKLILGISQIIDNVEKLNDKEYKVYKEIYLSNVEELEKDKKYKSVMGTHVLIVEIKDSKVFTNGKEVGEVKEKVFRNGELKIVLSKDIGRIKIENNKVYFLLDEKEKKERIKDLLNAIYNGLYYHSSGECVGIVPLFLIAGVVKVPIPVFHSFVDIEFYKQNHRPRFKIREDLLKKGISNGWVESNCEGKKLIFIESREPLALREDFIKNNSLDKWEEFLKEASIEKEEKHTNEQKD